MKKILTLCVFIVLITNTANAAFTESKTDKKEKPDVSTLFNQKAAASFPGISRKAFEQLTGRHLNVGERIAFGLFKLAARRHHEPETQTKGFHARGFFLPFLIGIAGLLAGTLIGSSIFLILGLPFASVLATYFFSKDKNLHKWAWIGFGAYLAILTTIVLFVILTGDFG